LCVLCHVCNDVQMDIRIRNVPPELHRTLKAEAALKSLSLEAYIIELLRKRKKLFKVKAGV
jgi:predicted HicB family RNase H-like nuclease